MRSRQATAAEEEAEAAEVAGSMEEEDVVENRRVGVLMLLARRFDSEQVGAVVSSYVF